MASKFRLGKGLDALLPIEESSGEGQPSFGFSAAGANGLSAEEKIISSSAAPALIPLNKLSANPNQPRKDFDEEALRELADSIREHGVIQPLLVEENGDGAYVIIAGERRSRAARMAGLTEVPALIRSYTDQQRMEISLIENIQRADLNPVEEAMAYRQLMDLTGLSQDEVAARVGKNRATVTNTLRLLKLPQDMIQALRDGGISSGHGRALLSVADPEAQKTLFNEITLKSVSVREAEKRAGDLNAGRDGKPAPGKEKAGPGDRGSAKDRRDAELDNIEQKFIDALGTKVVIDGDLKKGKIHIDYYSMEDMDRLLEILSK
ncbi:MAG: ParB/RepB/Spo0J family partition protein [Treponema sp.]|jgi:ParB family chromosome partitioning protein|nr:ParB/RepB/Spo0J family partition protein [Treponema sp.]